MCDGLGARRWGAREGEVALRRVAVALVLAWACCAPGCGVEEEAEAPPALTVADVTFLLPLGGAPGFSASGEGGHGALLPRSVFDRLEALTRVDEPEALYTHLDVVAVRLDPCFQEGEGSPPCAPQVRLVLQPVFAEAEGLVSRDATVHAFYAVPEGEVRALAASLARLRAARGGEERIGVHPSPEEAAALVLPRVGAGRLRRVTFVSVHASNQAWTFGGLDLRGGAAEALTIVGVGAEEQHLTSTGGVEALDATILPAPTIEPAAARWLAAVERAEMDAAAQAEARAGFARLADPSAHNPGTVDCASCHMASAALYRLGPPGEVSAAYADTQNQRMLGFFGRAPSISPRVEAETRVVLEALRAP
jgi:hypothetical protein